MALNRIVYYDLSTQDFHALLNILQSFGFQKNERNWQRYKTLAQTPKNLFVVIYPEIKLFQFFKGGNWQQYCDISYRQFDPITLITDLVTACL